MNGDKILSWEEWCEEYNEARIEELKDALEELKTVQEIIAQMHPCVISAPSTYTFLGGCPGCPCASYTQPCSD